MPGMSKTSSCQARTDTHDRLIEAGSPLADLQWGGGGELPGPIVAPALLDLVRKSRSYGLKLARRIDARGDDEQISAWAEVQPDDAGGCLIRISEWQARRLPEDQAAQDAGHKLAIAGDLAEFVARLGADFTVLAVTRHAGDTSELAARMEAGAGMRWTRFLSFDPACNPEGMGWRELQFSRVKVPGSGRNWTVNLRPVGRNGDQPAGYELALLAEEPASADAPAVHARCSADANGGLGREIAPALRQPVARIIANAETIRSQLAGPLAEEYANYAADIASAGEHLLALIDDLTDLEMVEKQGFTTAPDRIDLGDLARRAAGILALRAQGRQIAVIVPNEGETARAVGEFRRVLQILLNLLGNAIRYSPEHSRVTMTVGLEDSWAWITVADEGDGLDTDEQARIFRKFERLGRAGDGGSGLGLYISRRLADAMGGELSVESRKGEGARFTLRLPADIG